MIEETCSFSFKMSSDGSAERARGVSVVHKKLWAEHRKGYPREFEKLSWVDLIHDYRGT